MKQYWIASSGFNPSEFAFLNFVKKCIVASTTNPKEIKIDELANYCKANKIKAIGLADSYNLCGALEFAEKISKVGTQPIIGTQINLLNDNHIGKITLYATSEKGYKNLTKLSSLSYFKNKGSYDSCCEVDDLVLNNEDLILLTGNYNNFFGKLFYANKTKYFEKIIEKLRSSFKDRLYIEIQRHAESKEANYENYLFKISSSYDFPLIAGQEVYYLDSGMAEAHDALICIDSVRVTMADKWPMS